MPDPAALDPGVPDPAAPDLGSLTWLPAASRPDLLGAPVAAALPGLPGPAWVAEIDDDLADTAAFTEAYGVPLAASANCVVVAARRAGETTLAACLVLATTRADVNGLVRRHLGARKASFAPQDVAVAESGMAYGGITPVGLPAGWPVLVDAAVAAADLVVIGSGTRGSKLAVPGSLLAALPAAEVLDGLGQPLPAEAPAPPPAQPLRLDRAADDSDVGWGERPSDGSADDRRYLEDRPPHWGSD
ncbi:YbaK/EbsC family protein [Blastococcus atacamensis]|uniref:YbaK/EbsC family protein n=1 Tax=Blastococcus atacamensis TaxID=2070508 RepID=UPI0018E4AA59|nr:YbaK/EbsC family protein [Blastococcus atacamensis]